MRPFLGAKALGLATEWKFGFVGPGTVAESTPGVLYIDVGGDARPGVVDHHALAGQKTCAAELVLSKREAIYNHLLKDWIHLHAEGRILPGKKWTPVLVTHDKPDWDGVVASFLAMRLVEDGDFPQYAEALVAYAKEVDQGRFSIELGKPNDIFVPHIAYLAVQNFHAVKRNLSFEEQLKYGHQIIEKTTAAIKEARQQAGLRPIRSMDDFRAVTGTADWINDPWFDEIRTMLESEPLKFRRDYERATRIEGVALPSSDGGDPIAVPTFIANAPMESLLNKYWVRASGYPFFVCPYAGNRDADDNAGDKEHRIYQQVILSIDPNYNLKGRRPSLRGLGFALEQEETLVRRRINNDMDDRGGIPRFPDGYCNNEDPWYDGRAFDWTIVDAPRSGTRIPYATIIDIATKRYFWEIPIHHAIVSLVWGNYKESDSSERKVASLCIGNMANTLDDFYEECTEESCPTTDLEPCLTPGLSITGRIRRFPQYTCNPLQILTIEADPNTSLEALLECRKSIIRTRGLQAPDYVFAAISTENHFSEPTLASRLIGSISGGGELSSLSDPGEGNDLIFFNSRSIICRRDHIRFEVEEFRSQFEVLLYLAFLNESLIGFSKKISNLIPKQQELLEMVKTDELRKSFLRFQTCFYQIEASRTTRGRFLYEQISAFLKLTEQYAEVQSELDHLAQLENQVSEQRKARAERLMQLVLYFVAVFSVCQVLLSFYILDRSTLKSPSLWALLSGVLVTTVWVYIRIMKYRTKTDRVSRRRNRN
jgi:hypothetical protein